jgi:hypothetical protein
VLVPNGDSFHGKRWEEMGGDGRRKREKRERKKGKPESFPS